MDEKLYLIDLDCYARAEEKEKKKVLIVVDVQNDFVTVHVSSFME